MARLARAITQFTKKEISLLWHSARQAIKHGGFLLLKARRQGDIGRILIVIPKKVGSAPERNKLRRQIKALFFENKLYTGDYDWVFYAKPAVKELSFDDLKKLLLAQMKAE